MAASDRRCGDGDSLRILPLTRGKGIRARLRTQDINEASYAWGRLRSRGRRDGRVSILIDPQIWAGITPVVTPEITVAPIEPLSITPPLVDRLLEANRTAKSLDALRAQAEHTPGPPMPAGTKDPIPRLRMEGDLLTYGCRLVVPTGEDDSDALVTDLIREAHSQISSAHP